METSGDVPTMTRRSMRMDGSLRQLEPWCPCARRPPPPPTPPPLHRPFSAAEPSSAADPGSPQPSAILRIGGITEEFAATGSCTSPTDCSTQPCTMDVCWDGMGRRQIDDDCCACPEPPIADGNWGNQYHCYNEPCKEDLCWDGNPRREIDGRCCECPVDMWTNDCMPSDGGTPKLCGDKCSHVTSDGITYYGYCDLDMQCQSGLDDYAISTLCGPPVLDGHWGGDPLACVGKPCGAECSLRGQMYGRCASDYTCQPKQEDDWANLGCAKSDGGNDDPMGLCRAFLGDVTSLAQMMGGLMGGGSMGGMSGSGVCQVVGDEGLGLRRRLQTIGRRKLQMTATSAGLPDLPRDALVLAAAEIAGSRPGSAVPGVPPEAMAAAMAALQTSGLDMATITDLVATAASSSGSMPSPGSLASLLPAGLPPIDVAPCVSDVCRAQWEGCSSKLADACKYAADVYPFCAAFPPFWAQFSAGLELVEIAADPMFAAAVMNFAEWLLPTCMGTSVPNIDDIQIPSFWDDDHHGEEQEHDDHDCHDHDGCHEEQEPEEQEMDNVGACYDEAGNRKLCGAECDACVHEFAYRGGCILLGPDGFDGTPEDAVKYVPSGCDRCGMDAEVFCRDPEALCPGPCAAATEPDETVATIGRRPDPQDAGVHHAHARRVPQEAFHRRVPRL